MTDWTRCTVRICLVAAAVALISCGGSSATSHTTPSGSTAPTATPAATSSTTPSAPSEDPIAAAAAQYSPIVAALNVCEAQVSAEQGELPSTTQYSDLVPTSRELLACLQTFQAALSRVSFPPSVSTQASDLAAALQTLIASIQDFITNPDSTTWQAAVNANTAAGSASAAIRVALHLQPPPTVAP